MFTEFTDCCSTPLRRRDGPQGRLQGQPSSPEPLKDKTTHKGRTPTHYPSTGSVWKGSLVFVFFFLHCRLPLQDYRRGSTSWGVLGETRPQQELPGSFQSVLPYRVPIIATMEPFRGPSIPAWSPAARGPPWRTSSAVTDSAERRTRPEIRPSLDIICLRRCRLWDASGPSNHRPTDFRKSFYPRSARELNTDTGLWSEICVTQICTPGTLLEHTIGWSISTAPWYGCIPNRCTCM